MRDAKKIIINNVDAVLIGTQTYSYIPESWSQERFLELGGFTVVFLNYNKARFIEKSVASALNQDFDLLEMFFMDDASTDGSGDTMERLVRQYRGRHKVTVVRNACNQHIIGQWNIVSKIATGNWYGMFCADDIAFPNRVSLVVRKIGQVQTLKGLFTSGNDYDVKTGDMRKILGCGEEWRQFGTDDLSSLALNHKPIVGATAFWHRTLFSEQLPDGPFDDIILRWVLQWKYRNCKDPIWMNAGTLETITYACGVGISTEMQNRDSSVGYWSCVRKWRNDVVSRRKFDGLVAHTWDAVKSYYVKNGAERCFVDFAKWHYVKFQVSACNTVGKILLAPRLGGVIIGTMSFRAKIFLFRRYIKLLAQEFFGLAVAAFIMGTIHRFRKVAVDGNN